MNFDAEVPIIIVGAGACGLVAAMAANSDGGEVVVLERDPVPQGSTALSSGLIPAAGTKAQKAQGLDDSADKMAADIIEIATKESITVFQSPLLARALYFTGNIGQEIHEELFSAVAAVLAFIFRVAKGEELDPPDISIPNDLQFNETGAPLNG